MKAIKTPLFQPNSETINQQLKEARHQFAHQYKNMARIRLLNTLQLCVSCHTQLPPNQASSFSSGLKDFSKQNFSSFYEHATFLFIVRNYKESQLQFEKAIKDYLTEIKKMNEVKSKNVGSYNIKPLHDSFKKILEILVKVNQNPTDATNFINKYIDTTELPAIIKSELSSWKNQLTKLSRQESLKLKNDLDVNRFINQTLNEFDQAGRPQVGYEMNLLLASGHLTRYLYQNPETQKSQEILYWMGVISHRLNLNLFYDVGDLYLKQCMEKYKKNNYSKKCFDEFAEQIQFGYTGSSGTDIPAEISAELEKYRKLTH